MAATGSQTPSQGTLFSHPPPPHATEDTDLLGHRLALDNAEHDRQLGSAATISYAGASPSAAALQALEQYKKKDSSKVVVRFKAIGNAPIMKVRPSFLYATCPEPVSHRVCDPFAWQTNYFRITAFNRFQAVIQFLRKELNFKPTDSLVFSPLDVDAQFLYINASFSPAPDDTVGNLYRCFGTENHLIVNYSTTAAWG
ncbi:protein conjugation factor [Moesziomyces antarcticus T-34]|uniref:Ubiquitin-like protein ATG12 n=1 Tax=Pseudozyma antarctica (strain T-34) TaxID=1151754 RepID=M9LMU9_PSEA3|nr:protein conjugation factor [Moesziomyces antarcticus T-34]